MIDTTHVAVRHVFLSWFLVFDAVSSTSFRTAFSLPKFLFFVDRYVVLPMLVCVSRLRHITGETLIYSDPAADLDLILQI